MYGKTIENLRKRVHVKLINNSKDSVRSVSRYQKIFDKNFAAIHQIKPFSILDKSICVGFSTLELSKLLMYKFHYGYVKIKFNVKLLLTDTDSLVYEIKGKNVYENCYSDRYLFDFSDYPLDSKYYAVSNKRYPGKMKNEYKGEIITEFVGLKSKMYSLITAKDQKVSKAKGVNKKIKHKEFVDVLFNKSVVRHSTKRIQSKLHSVGTCNLFKISLSYSDDNRYVLIDGVNTLAYFRKDIKKL